MNTSNKATRDYLTPEEQELFDLLYKLGGLLIKEKEQLTSLPVYPVQVVDHIGLTLGAIVAARGQLLGEARDRAREARTHDKANAVSLRPGSDRQS